MPTTTLLMVCSEKDVIGAIHKISAGIDKLHFEAAAGINEACIRLERPGIGLILVYLCPGTKVPEVARLLRTISAQQQAIATLVLGDDSQAEKALALLRLGVADYLSWPNDVGRVGYLMEMLTVRARFSTPDLQPVAELAPLQEEDSFLAMGLGNMLDQVKRAASRDVTILLGGETGTGKSRLARLIHEHSPFCEQPFFTVNCGSLSTNLIESELFGHVKGAFTGANQDRAGKFAEASGGTLFLDDIDGLPLALQPKLLRAVEERIFEPVGTNKSMPLKARVIAASNRPLEEEVTAGRFRSDLFFRLNVVGFFLPPLRERSGAVRALTSTFITELAGGKGSPIHRIALDALQALESYHWPGNIRELRNVLDRAITLCPGNEIGVDDLPATLTTAVQPATALPIAASPAATPASLAQAKGKAELTRILAAIQSQKNVRARVAAELGVSRNTLYKKLRKYGLLALPS